MNRNRSIRFLLAFIVTYTATVGTVWGLLEAYTYFTGDELRKILGGYWVLVMYGAPIPIALLVTFIKDSIDTQKQKKSRLIPQARFNNGLLGENPEPLTMCKYLQTLVAHNTPIIQKSDKRQLYVEELVQNLKDGIVRIYFFGHQNAGKSSLINVLLNVDELSPTFPGKMTTCLVRIRWAARSRLVECYSNEVEDRKREISKLKRKMEEWSSLPLEGRPREVIIEIPNKFLESNKIEVVDSPGTGSGRNRYGKSLEDEIVDSGLKSGALAIVVYRDTSAELESHEKLVRHLGGNNIFTIAVCNLDSNWATELRRNKHNIQRTIARAEKKLRDEARAECYRIAITDEENVKELARQEGGTTIEEFRIFLVELLGDRKKYAERQAIRSGHLLIEELLQETGQYIRQHQPYFNQIEDERKKISEAILGVREVLNKSYKPANTAAWGTAVGTASTLITGTALSVVTAGTYFLWAAAGAAAGAAVGYLVDRTEREDFLKRLADKWSRLQQAVVKSTKITSTEMITQEVIKKIRASSSSLSEFQHKSILNELDTELNGNLQKIEGYGTYHSSQDLDEQLRLLKEYFLKE